VVCVVQNPNVMDGKLGGERMEDVVVCEYLARAKVS